MTVAACTRPPTPSQARVLAVIRWHADAGRQAPKPAEIARKLGFYRGGSIDAQRVRVLIDGLRRRGFLHTEGDGA